MNITPEQYATVIQWTRSNFIPSKAINYQYSAYTIHGIFE